MPTILFTRDKGGPTKLTRAKDHTWRYSGEGFVQDHDELDEALKEIFIRGDEFDRVEGAEGEHGEIHAAIGRGLDARVDYYEDYGVEEGDAAWGWVQDALRRARKSRGAFDNPSKPRMLSRLKRW